MEEELKQTIKQAQESEKYQCSQCTEENDGCRECALYEQKKSIQFRIERNHYRKVLERIRDWALTSKASSNILRGFARKALEDASN
jgi:hypothetical protein